MDTFACRLAALETRLQSLETQNRKLRNAITLAVACVIASLAIAAAQPRTVTTSKLVITDAAGHTRAQLDDTGLQFRNAGGQHLANFWVNPKTGSGLVFSDGQHTFGRLGIGMWGKHPGLGIDDAAGHERLWLGEEDYGSSVSLYDAANKKRLSSEAQQSESHFLVYDSNGKVRAAVYLGSDESGLSLRDGEEKARARVYVTTTPAMKLYNADGDTLWGAP